MQLNADRLFRPFAIAAASLLITSIASIGQVQHELNKTDSTEVATGATSTTVVGGGADTSTTLPGQVPVDGSTPASVEGGPGAPRGAIGGAGTVALDCANPMLH